MSRFGAFECHNARLRDGSIPSPGAWQRQALTGGPSGFMIMGQNGRYLPQTIHDHDLHPECLNVKFRHNGTYRITSRTRLATGGEVTLTVASTANRRAWAQLACPLSVLVCHKAHYRAANTPW
jgi:hypothetical protein